jgi:Phage integrase family.
MPKKDLSLHNLRHTAIDILEKACLTDEEIDAVLGHHEIKTALPFYKDRSADAIARRLSGRTKKGILILSDIVKGFFRK